MTLKEDHVPLYDMIRLFAIFLVVLGHSTYLTITTGLGGINYTFDTAKEVFASTFFKEWLYWSAWVYLFHIQLFIMLAGSVFALRPEMDFKTLLIKKAKRLWVPFLLCGLFFMIPLKVAGGFYQAEKLSQIITAFLTGQGYESGHLWFLPKLFWCFVWFAALLKILKKPVLICAVSLLLWFFSAKLPEIFSFEYLIFFATGFYFDKCRLILLKRPKTVLSLTALFVFFNIISNVKYLRLWYPLYYWEHFGRFISLFAAMSGALLVYFIALSFYVFFKKKTKSSLIEKAAKQTFSVYLYHDPLMIVMLAFFAAHESLVSAAGGYIYFLCRTIGVVALSVVIGFLIGKGKEIVRRFAYH